MLRESLGPRDPWFSTARSFFKLKFLDLLVEILPASIRCFYLCHTQKEAAANMMTLADCLDDFPSLKEVLLSGNGVGGPLGQEEVVFDEEEIEYLRMKFTSRGIRFLKFAGVRGLWEAMRRGGTTDSFGLQKRVDAPME